MCHSCDISILEMNYLIEFDIRSMIRWNYQIPEKYLEDDYYLRNVVVTPIKYIVEDETILFLIMNPYDYNNDTSADQVEYFKVKIDQINDQKELNKILEFFSYDH